MFLCVFGMCGVHVFNYVCVRVCGVFVKVRVCVLFVSICVGFCVWYACGVFVFVCVVNT